LIYTALITYPQAIVLGLLQGVSELFPISSLGHSVILPSLLGWDIHQNDQYFLTFLVATHLATALVLLGFFWADWVRIVKGIGRSLRDRGIDPEDADAKLGWLLVVGTIPAGILGLALEHKLRSVFASPQSAAIFLTLNGLLLEHALRDFFASGRSASFFLILNGFVLYGAERLRRRAPEVVEGEQDGDVRVAETASYGDAAGIGAAQALALIPGFSRTGVTIGGGLVAGLSHEDAARFSFLLATPIIGAAAVLKLPELLGSQGDNVRGQALVGALGAALTAYLSVRFLLRYFETNSLTPFAIYCVVVGITLTTSCAVT